MGVQTRSELREWRSGQVQMFALLVLAMVTSGVFVGHWLSLAGGRTPMPRAGAWMLATVIAILTVAAFLTRLIPGWLCLRHRWEPLPTAEFPNETATFQAAAGAAGLQDVPELVWNPRSKAGEPRAWGRPGRFRVTVSPRVLTTARLKPETFTVVLQHELAHIRLRDVTLSYATFAIWWSTMAALVVPVVFRVVDHDLSVLPVYLPRAVGLALIVHLAGTATLRRREHAADLAAADALADRSIVVGVLQSRAVGEKRRNVVRRYVAWHPTMACRAQVVAEPQLACQLTGGEMLGVGLICGLPIPLIADLFDAVGTVTAVQIARAVAFGLAGWYIAGAVQRVAPHLPRKQIAIPAVALAAGVALSQAVSLGGGHLARLIADDVVGYSVTAILLAAVTVWAFDMARRPRQPRAHASVTIAVALAFVLAADAVLTVAELIRLEGAGFLSDHLTTALTERPTATAFVVLVVTVGLPVTVRPVRQAPGLPARVLLAGALGGAAAGLLTLVLRVATAPTSGEEKWGFYLRSIWTIALFAVLIAAVGAVRHPARVAVPHAITAAALAVIAGAITFVVLNDVCFHSTLGVPDAINTARYSGVISVLVVLPLLTGITLLREPREEQADP